MAADLKLSSAKGRFRLQHVSPAQEDPDVRVADVATLSPDIVSDPGASASSSFSFAFIAGY
jgi:hypothetical protein